MSNLSKKILRFSENYNYPRDYYYDRLTSKYENPSFFCSLFEKQGLLEFKTLREIKFRKGIRFDADAKSIISLLGRPNFILDKKEFFNYKILFYRFKIGGHKTKCELHLLNDKLFFFSYVFSYLTSKDKKSFNQILASKYIQDKTAPIAKYKITDISDNIMMVDDSIDYSVVYMSGNAEIYEVIKKELEKMRRVKDRKVQVKYNELYKAL
jgi:hypothetical protein